jgi:hypothetical protein
METSASCLPASRTKLASTSARSMADSHEGSTSRVRQMVRAVGALLGLQPLGHLHPKLVTHLITVRVPQHGMGPAVAHPNCRCHMVGMRRAMSKAATMPKRPPAHGVSKRPAPRVRPHARRAASRAASALIAVSARGTRVPAGSRGRSRCPIPATAATPPALGHASTTSTPTAVR